MATGLAAWLPENLLFYSDSNPGTLDIQDSNAPKGQIPHRDPQPARHLDQELTGHSTVIPPAHTDLHDDPQPT